STVAGGGTVSLVMPVAVAVDPAGTLLLSDNGAIRSCGSSGACGTVSGVQTAGDLVLDAAGNLWVASGMQVFRIDPRGQVRTVAGDAYQHAIGDGGPATAAQLFQPAGVALDAAGNLWIADTGTCRVREAAAAGAIATADGPADLHSPTGVALNAAGEAIVADTANHRIRKVSGGAATTIAGTGTAGIGPEGLAPLQTALNGPRGVCVDGAGTVYAVDTGNHRVLRVGTVVTTAAGNGTAGYAGDGGPARLAQLNQPSACAADAAGNLWIADTGNHRIRKVAATGVISTFAGTGTAGGGGDEGPAGSAALDAPQGVEADGGGNVYIADTANHRLREVTADGVIHTIAGSGAAGFAGDGGPGLKAQLHSPSGLALDRAGNLYVADTGNNRVRRLAAPAASTGTQLFSIANAASGLDGPVSPGEIVSIFGEGMGPDPAAVAAFDSSGSLPTQLGGAEVHFDGVAAPLFYAQSGQINVQVPYGVGAGTTHVEIYYQGALVRAVDLAVAASAPGLFAFASSADNPAPRGSVVVLYGTGEGLTTGPNVAGQAALAPYPQPLLPVSLTIAGVPAQLLYAGSAPGTAGVLQVNAVVPGGFVQPGPAVARLSIGGAVSPPLTIWLQ
ncbi:MAG TPA: hypothetical protein VGS58_01960, partial [Candidatus Sulfopaludibacter sp.]|nr:hypothetical protein [Candidatus Sulfopaludibacter sp.]